MYLQNLYLTKDSQRTPTNLQINKKNNHNFKRPKGLKKYAEKDDIQVANKCSKCIQNHSSSGKSKLKPHYFLAVWLSFKFLNCKMMIVNRFNGPGCCEGWMR